MPDEITVRDDSSSQDELPREIVDAIADSSATSVGEQPAILANLALANQIFNTCLAQQDAIVNQQIITTVKLAALAKCLQIILAVNASDPKAVELIKETIIELFDQLHGKVEERIAAGQSEMEEKLNQLRAQAAALRPEQS